MQVADIARLYNTSTLTIYIILKKNEEIIGVDADKSHESIKAMAMYLLEDVVYSFYMNMNIVEQTF